MLTNLYNI